MYADERSYNRRSVLIINLQRFVPTLLGWRELSLSLYCYLPVLCEHNFCVELFRYVPHEAGVIGEQLDLPLKILHPNSNNLALLN